MKKISFLILLFPFFSFSQIVIKGKVKNDKEVIPFANVLLLDQSNQIIKATVTDQAGFYEIETVAGNYQLSINYIGHEDYSKEINVNMNQTLDDVILIQKQTDLAEIVVVSTKKRITQKIDKMVFNIQDSPISSGGSALEALKVAPGVIVKPNEVVMIGKSGTRVMVDGRFVQLAGEDLINFLASIPANDIKEIEIITNPSSKYEAEGSGGIINIIYKSAKKNSWNNNSSLTYTQARLGYYALKNSFSYNKDKINIGFSIGDVLGKDYKDQRAEIYYSKGPYKINSIQHQKFYDFSLRFLIDYSINKNTQIGIQYLGTAAKSDTDDDINTRIYDTSNAIDSLLIGRGNNNFKRNNNSLNAHYDRKIDSLGKNLSINIDYLDYNSTQNNKIVTDSYVVSPYQFLGVNFANKSDGGYNVKNYNAKIDIEHPIDFIKLSYGAKINFTNTRFNVNNYNIITGDPVLNPLQSNRFEYKENIESLYINGSKKFNDKWDSQFGLRLESTQTEGMAVELNQINENNYLKLFPSFFVSYKNNDNNMFLINYGRRIERPSFSQLNPARYYINSKTSSGGNPFLKPVFTNNLEFTHTYKSNLSTKLSLNIKTDASDVVLYLNDKTNEQMVTFENFYNNYTYGLTESYLLKISSRWESQNSLYLLYSQSKKNNNNLDANINSGPELYFTSNNSINFNEAKSIVGEINFWYDSAHNDNIYHYSQASSLDLALTIKSLFKNFKLTTGVYDVFNSSNRTMNSVVNNIKQNFISYPSSRYFKISLIYDFGNKDISNTSRNFGNEEERRRSN